MHQGFTVGSKALWDQACGLQPKFIKFSLAIMFLLLPHQSKILSMWYTVKTFFRNLASLTPWQNQQTSSVCSPATSHTPQSQYARLVGRVVTHFPSTAANTCNSARFKLATDTETVAQFPCLRRSSKVNAGKCNSKVAAAPHTAAVPTVALCCGRVSASFWLKSTCTPLAYPQHGL